MTNHKTGSISQRSQVSGSTMSVSTKDYTDIANVTHRNWNSQQQMTGNKYPASCCAVSCYSSFYSVNIDKEVPFCDLPRSSNLSSCIPS
ncbi:hypothetical protein J6590_059962 [Homalodisca vitripennis]|nr:hypothetical protein J6590_059962 [Homalodisca vitripennis]